MTIAFNHTIIAARDRHESASFFTKLFGLPDPTLWGPFAIVALDHGVFIQFAAPDVTDIQMQHYAFLVDDPSFDAIYGRMLDGGIAHWADPQQTLPGQINTNHGGR
ncbi:MAG: VOC family protein, partial [Thermomicrobia bacterium]|nr:VOC family protein [Thermomicrobia bacterium]